MMECENLEVQKTGREVLPGNQRPRVLCVASPNWFGASRLPMVLSDAGCDVFVLAHPKSYVANSSVVRGVILGAWEPEKNLEVLRVHLDAGVRYDWVIFADDPTMMEVVRRRRELWLKPWVPMDSGDAWAEVLLHKTMFIERAGAAGLPVPPSRTVSAGLELRRAAEEIGFPLIVKPSSGFAGNGIFRIDTNEALERVETLEGIWSVQKLVVGRSGGTAVLFCEGRPVWWQSSLRTKVWPEPYGPSCRRKLIDLPEMSWILERLAPLVGMRGLCEVEWMLPDAGGPPLLIEFNPRPAAYLYLTPFMGADLSGAIGSFFGKRSGIIPEQMSRGIEVALFPEDAIQAAQQLDWGRLFAWASGRCGPKFAGEPRVFRSYVWLVIKTLLKSLFRSLRGK